MNNATANLNANVTDDVRSEIAPDHAPGSVFPTIDAEALEHVTGGGFGLGKLATLAVKTVMPKV
jgi:hypothetical protein